MPRQKLTDTIAARAVLPPGKAELLLADADLVGFGLRVRTGAKSWILTYRPSGAGRSAAPKRLKLGSADTMKAGEARVLARAAMGQVASGKDPLDERRLAKRKSESSVAHLLDRYQRDLERRHYVNRKVVIDGLRKRLTPLLATDVREVTGQQLMAIVEAARSAGHPGAAEDFRSRCRAFLSWCAVSAKAIPSNPLAGFRKERATRADKIAREQHGRALTDAELVAVWRAADPRTTFGRYVRFLALTGCRRAEAAGLTWAMIDRAAMVIRLPAAFVKQGRGHDVPIVPELGVLLDACPIDARSELVFASSKTGGRMSGWTQLVARLNDRSCVAFGLHDLRRTFRTGLSRLGVDSDIAELALGHARDTLEAIYNRDDAGAVLRSAFERWAGHLAEVTKEASPALPTPVGGIFD